MNVRSGVFISAIAAINNPRPAPEVFLPNHANYHMAKKLKKPNTVKTRLIACGIFILALAASLLTELFVPVHASFGLDGKMFFHAIYGFLSCLIIVLLSKFLGLFLKWKEDYYGE